MGGREQQSGGTRAGTWSGLSPKALRKKITTFLPCFCKTTSYSDVWFSTTLLEKKKSHPPMGNIFNCRERGLALEDFVAVVITLMISALD